LVFLLLGSASDSTVCNVAAVMILAINVSFVLMCAMAIANEILDGVDLEAPVDPSKWFGKSPIGKCFAYLLKGLLKYALKVIMFVILALVGQLQKERIRLLKKVPHLIWQGRGHHIAIAEYRRPHDAPRWYHIMPHRHVYIFMARKMFSLGNDQQRDLIADSLSSLMKHMMSNAKFHCLPVHLIDMLVVMPRALRNLRRPTAEPEAVDVGAEVRRIFRHADHPRFQWHPMKSEKVSVGASFFEEHSFSDIDEHMYSCQAADLVDAVVYVQSQTPASLRDMVCAAFGRKNTLYKTCRCGTIWLDDTPFCRKCGAPRSMASIAI